MLLSKQILHSSSVRCFLLGGSSSPADAKGRRCSHSMNSRNPSPGSDRLVTSPPRQCDGRFVFSMDQLIHPRLSPSRNYSVCMVRPKSSSLTPVPGPRRKTFPCVARLLIRPHVFCGDKCEIVGRTLASLVGPRHSTLDQDV